VYVFKRLYGIAEKIMDSRRKKWPTDRVDVENVDLYPYFTSHIKDLYHKFIDNAAKHCKEKCLDEFYSSKTIFWELTEFSDRKLLTDRADKSADETKQAVSSLAGQLFKNIRERITKNVMLKFYNFFLVPMYAPQILLCPNIALTTTNLLLLLLQAIWFVEWCSP